MSIADRIHLSAPHMGGREQILVGEAFATNWIAPTGPFVDAFEGALARLVGVHHAAALSSGTAALHLALRLADVGPGDEVWGATMTFIGGVAPILYQGGVPVFLDIVRDGMLIDLDLLEDALITARRADRLPKVVITTDLYGNVVDMTRTRRLADDFGFVWISDTAEAVGAYRGDAHAGHGADLIILSFNGNKIITTSGGGALLSDNSDWIARARFLSTQARDPAPHYEHTTFGYNYRLSNVCAAIGCGQLEVLAKHVDARRAVFDRYRQALGAIPGIEFASEPGNSRANRWLTTLLIDPAQAGFDREAVRTALEAENIESRPVWKPMHLQPVFAGARTIGGDVAALAFDQGLCLPSTSSLRPDQIARVIDVVRRVAGQPA